MSSRLDIPYIFVPQPGANPQGYTRDDFWNRVTRWLKATYTANGVAPHGFTSRIFRADNATGQTPVLLSVHLSCYRRGIASVTDRSGFLLQVGVRSIDAISEETEFSDFLFSFGRNIKHYGNYLSATSWEVIGKAIRISTFDFSTGGTCDYRATINWVIRDNTTWWFYQ